MPVMENISAVKFRRFHTDDAHVLAQVRAEAATEAGLGNQSTLGLPPTSEEIRSAGANAAENNFVVAELRGEVAGYSTLTHWPEASGITIFLIDGYVAARARNHGVGTEMLHHMEHLASAKAVSMGVQDDAVYGAGASKPETTRRLLLEDNGYSFVFSMVEMELVDLSRIDPTEADKEFQLSSATVEDCRQMWELDELVYDGRPFTLATSSDSLERFTERASEDLSLWFVARQNDTIVGYVSSRDRVNYAEITDVNVHPEHRRRGLAKALLTRNLVELRNRDFGRVRLHTNGENRSGAYSLYTSIGFELRERRLRFRKAMSATARLY